ncbi:hypothetical protein MSAN_00311100 [Mycena sanguinolenta]|uniref:Uncharacterized protein n=1 Tax=Mycena sanguinolenta TaxID=230812 RepID=A0A8H6ZCC7_9AGAR|nr:hypothetical protein MSAN_00311100 [Mycena sanguinolenta]
MSPTFLRARASFEFAIEGGLSARSESAVDSQFSLDAWQIVGIVLVILLLGGLVGGGIWWETKAKLAEETALLASEGKTTAGMNTADEAPELELEVQSPQKIQNSAEVSVHGIPIPLNHSWVANP